MCVGSTQLYNSLHNVLASAAHLACKYSNTHMRTHKCIHADVFPLPLISASRPWAACVQSSFSSPFGFYRLSLVDDPLAIIGVVMSCSDSHLCRWIFSIGMN